MPKEVLDVISNIHKATLSLSERSVGKTESISLGRGLAIYRQSHASGWKTANWYSRVWMPDGSGREYHVRTTGTSDRRIAEQKARDHWFQCESLKKGLIDPSFLGKNRVPLDKRFDRIAEHRFSQLESRVGPDRKAARRLKDERDAYFGKNGSAKFFGRRDVSTITTEDIRQFLQFRIDNSIKGYLAPASQKRALVCLRLVLKDAYERQLITNIPLMPKVKLTQTPRGWFDKAEYRLMWEKARTLARQAQSADDQDGPRHWMEMFDFIVFMVNTFLRPSEWADLRQRHVKVIDGDTPHLEIAMGQGKTGPRVVLSMPRAISVYKRMIARNGQDPDGFLFRPDLTNRQTAKERMRDSFEVLLNATGLKHDAFGKPRTIGSLRHTSLMFRFEEGENVNLRTLADNAGTSIKQLEDFYLSHSKTSTKLANLQSFKPRKPQAQVA